MRRNIRGPCFEKLPVLRLDHLDEDLPSTEASKLCPCPLHNVDSLRLLDS